MSRLRDIVKAKGLIKTFPDLANMAQEIRLKRREEYGDENMVDDSAERKKDGIARRARRTKKSLFGGA
jgi:hypothetical protein